MLNLMGILIKSAIFLALVLSSSMIAIGQITSPTATPDRDEVGIKVLAWSPNGEQIALSGGYLSCDWDVPERFNINIIDSVSYKAERTLSGFVCPVTSIDWSSDGHKIAATSFNDLRVWDVQSEELISTLQRGSRDVNSVKWNADNTLLAVAFMHGGVSIIDPMTGGVVDLPRIQGGRVDWNPHTGKLATGSWYSTSVFVGETDYSSEPVEFLGNEQEINDVAWSPNGDKLASGGWDSSVRVWDSTTRTLLFTFTHDSEQVADIDWHPSEPLLASLGYDKIINIWDADTGKRVRQFQLETSAYAIDWKPDGRVLAYADGSDTFKTIEFQPLPTLTPSPAVSATATP